MTTYSKPNRFLDAAQRRSGGAICPADRRVDDRLTRQPPAQGAATYEPASTSNQLQGVTILGTLMTIGFADASLIAGSAPSIWNIGLVLAMLALGIGLIGLVLRNAAASICAETTRSSSSRE